MNRSRGWWIWLAVFGLVVLSGGVAAVMINKNWLNNINAPKYVPLLNAAEDKYGIPHNLLARQAYQESHFRDDIVDGQTISSAGALGLMQIVPKYHPDVNPLDLLAAIDYAGSLMAGWYNQFGSWALALAAYNAGPGNVEKYGGVPPFDETQNYVAQILSDLVDQNNPASQAMYS